MNDATADPIGVPQDVLNAFLDCPGSLEASLSAAVGKANATIAKMREEHDAWREEKKRLIAQVNARIDALVAENERLKRVIAELQTPEICP